MIIDIINHLDLLLDYLWEDAILCWEKSSGAVLFLLDFGVDAHPERDSWYYLEDYAS